MFEFSRRSFLVTTASAGLVACTPMSRPGGTGGGAAAQARALYDTIFERLLAASPETATALGLDTGARAALKSQFSDASPAGKLGQYRPLVEALPQLRAIDRNRLAGRERGWLDTAIWFGERGAEMRAIPYGTARGGYPAPYLLSQLTGSYQSVPDFLDSQHKIETAADAQAYLDRLDRFHRNIDLEVEAARADAARGVIPPAYIIDKALAQSRSLAGERGAEAGLVRSLTRRARERQIAGDWESRAVRIVDGPLQASLGRQIGLFQDFRRRAGEAPGAGRLPEGAAFYAQALRYHTSTNMTPQAIHQLGLEQVAALNAEAEPLLRAQNMTQGSVGARISALAERPDQGYPNSDAGREQLLAYLRQLIGTLRSRMPEIFYTLPTSGMEVRRVPAAIEVGSPGAYAQSGDLEGTRPGIFYINLADMSGRPRWSLPTLTCHEAVPGHLWQGAIVNSAKNIPLLHRSLGIPAFGEGWGLYAETLGDEVGLYRDDPAGKIGMIQSFLFRSARLVVDTGMHALGWSREQAIRYFMETVGRERAGAEREIDRYIVWPGQACSYKIGHNEMLRIREDARRRLGARFDIKAFHDLVLLSGDMPLEVLDRMTREWDGSRMV